jgi:glycosyltransferase involved in cell wall biosynthesis
VKIGFVCGEYPPGPHGGVGTMTRVLARALVARGHEVRVAGVYPVDYAAPDIEEDQGVRVLRLREKPGRFGWLLSRHELYKTVAGWARRGEADLVEGPDSRGWFAGWPRMPIPVAQRSNGSYTYFAHELGRPVASTTFRLERWSYRRSIAWAAVSRHTGAITARLFGLGAGPDAVLHNPVDVPLTMPPFERRSTSRVVFTGTLTEKKGVLSLIDAWPAVKAKCPAAQLEVFGKDPKGATGQTMQQRMVERLPEALRESVTFRGHVGAGELRAALSTGRLAIFPSYTEAFALAPLESMGCGCPTISTKRSSGPEGVRAGVDGLLVDPDKPAEVADAIVQLLTDDALARRLGEAGRARVLEAFTIPALMPANEAFYDGVLRTFAGSKRP